MITVEWHNTEKSHIGKSTCGKYLIEIIGNGSHFDYTITETKSNQIKHKNTTTHNNVEDAKRIVMSLLSLKYAII